jgi:Flp pilus assembly protein protease CpaA
MSAMAWIGAALLTILMLPAIAGELENKAIPWPYHAALGIIGLIFAWTTRGAGPAMLALLTGAALLALLAVGTAALSRSWGIRLLGGADIRLLSAAAIWVGPAGVIPLLAVTAATFVAVAVVLRIRTRRVVRPTIALITGFCVVAIFLGYSA